MSVPGCCSAGGDVVVVCVMIRRPARSTLTNTLTAYTTLFPFGSAGVTVLGAQLERHQRAFDLGGRGHLGDAVAPFLEADRHLQDGVPELGGEVEIGSAHV